MKYRGYSHEVDEWFLNLSVWAQNSLAAAGLSTESAVRESFAKDGGVYLRKSPNLGAKTLREIGESLVIDFDASKNPPSDSQIRGAITLLTNNGYRVIKCRKPL